MTAKDRVFVGVFALLTLAPAPTAADRVKKACEREPVNKQTHERPLGRTRRTTWSPAEP